MHNSLKVKFFFQNNSYKSVVVVTYSRTIICKIVFLFSQAWLWRLWSHHYKSFLLLHSWSWLWIIKSSDRSETNLFSLSITDSWRGLELQFLSNFNLRTIQNYTGVANFFCQNDTRLQSFICVYFLAGKFS